MPLVQYFKDLKIVNEEEALVNTAETGEIETKETPSRTRKQSKGSKIYCYTSQLKYVIRLEENVSQKLTNSLGQIKLTNSLGRIKLTP